jgi:hypothetical protein
MSNVDSHGVDFAAMGETFFARVASRKERKFVND